MNRVLIVLGALAGLIILVAVIGWLLPQSHTATARRSYDSPADDAWRLITDVEGYPEWRPYVERVEIISSPGEPLTWKETWEGRNAITFEVLDVVDGKTLVTGIVDDDLPFGGTWTYEVAPTSQGCTVTITENGEIYDPFFRFVSHLFLDQTETMNAYLDHLEAALGAAAKTGAVY